MAAVGIPGMAYAVTGPTVPLHTGFFGVDGAEYHYSSTNYLLLTALIEAATGQPYTDHAAGARSARHGDNDHDARTGHAQAAARSSFCLWTTGALHDAL